MSTFREKAEAQTEQVIGQMLGDELLVREGQARLRKAEMESDPSEPTKNQTDNQSNDQTRNRPNEKAKGPDQGIVRDERGQEQPKDKARAQQVSRVNRGGDPPGKKV